MAQQYISKHVSPNAELQYRRLADSPCQRAMDNPEPSEPDQAVVQQRAHLGIAQEPEREACGGHEEAPVDDGEGDEDEPRGPREPDVRVQPGLAVDEEALAQDLGHEDAEADQPDGRRPAQDAEEESPVAHDEEREDGGPHEGGAEEEDEHSYLAAANACAHRLSGSV